jgi:addiction module HigA family antidote
MLEHVPLKTQEDRSEPAPLHPGEILRLDILPHLGLSPIRFAAHLDLPLSVVAAVLAERAPVTLDIAVKLAAALSTDARYWLALQMQHDLWQARQAPECEIRPIRMRGGNWRSYMNRAQVRAK